MTSRLREMISLLESKADWVVKNFGEKIAAAAHSDDSEEAKKFKKKRGADGEVDPAMVGEVVKKLEAISSKHLVWIGRMYAGKQFKLEDAERLKGELDNFDKYQKKLEKKDLNAYKSLDELYNALDPVVKAGKAEEEAPKLPDKASDAEFLIRSKNYIALIPKTEEASCKYGAGTRWCTAATGGHNYFKSYAQRGDLIIIIAKFEEGYRKFQFHFESGSFMNEQDRPADKADVKQLSKFPEHIKLIHMLIDKYHPEDEDDK